MPTYSSHKIHAPLAAVVAWGCVFLTTQSCSLSKPNPEKVAATPAFQSNLTAEAAAEPIPVAAEIAADLTTQLQTPGNSKAHDPGAPAQPPIAPSQGRRLASTVPGDPPQPPRESGEGRVIRHVVKSNETLMKIALEHFGDLYRWKEIYNDNREKVLNPNLLTQGTVLSVRIFGAVPVEKNGAPYLIRRNDTLSKISKFIYGTTANWRALWENNRQMIHDPHWIFAGLHLYYVLTAQQQKDVELLKTASAAPASR